LIASEIGAVLRPRTLPLEGHSAFRPLSPPPLSGPAAAARRPVPVATRIAESSAAPARWSPAGAPRL